MTPCQVFVLIQNYMGTVTIMFCNKWHNIIPTIHVCLWYVRANMFQASSWLEIYLKALNVTQNEKLFIHHFFMYPYELVVIQIHANWPTRYTHSYKTNIKKIWFLLRKNPKLNVLPFLIIGLSIFFFLRILIRYFITHNTFACAYTIFTSCSSTI